MLSSIRKRLVALVLACLMLFGSCAAIAESVMVMRSATVYAVKGNSLVEVGTLPAGTTLNRTAQNSGWSMVNISGNTGFVLSDNVAAVTNLNGKTAYATSDISMYASFNTSSKKLATIPKDASVSMGYSVSSWVCVSYGSTVGFVKSSGLTTTKPALTQQPTFTSYTAYACVDDAKLYNGSGKVVGKIALNTSVTVNAVNGALSLVSYKNKTYIMMGNELSTKKTESQPAGGITTITPTTYYVREDGTAYYNGSGKVMGTLDQNATVTVSAFNGALALVTYDGKQAIMYTDTLSEKKISLALKYGDSGEAVERLQARLLELGYFSGTVAGNYLDLTKSAVAAFQKQVGLTADGIAGEATLNALFSENAPKAPEPEKKGPSTVPAATGTAVEMDWWTSDIQSIFPRGATAKITDVNTGIAWQEVRTGGTNHADVQPATADDTAAMKAAVGSWSWNRRPIFVTIKGVNYAASMNCMPHGSDTIDANNFSGHHCIHFTNSRTHGTDSICSLHQAAIKKAAKAVL